VLSLEQFSTMIENAKAEVLGRLNVMQSISDINNATEIEEEKTNSEEVSTKDIEAILIKEKQKMDDFFKENEFDENDPRQKEEKEKHKFSIEYDREY